MMTRNLLIAAILLLMFSNGVAIVQAQSQLPPPKTVEELKRRLADEMTKQHVAGMMLAIVTRDSVICSDGVGFADLDKKSPVTSEHLFRQASVTKLFTALGILNLIRDGKLSAGTRLKDVAPEIRFNNDWENTHSVTIAQLLEHSTAFSDKSPFEEYNFSARDFNGLNALKILEKFMVSRWKPGERHAYSGVNYAILAYIVEKVSGKSFNSYMSEKVFRPLGMPFANVKLTADHANHYSKGYVWKGDHFQLVPHQKQFNPGYGSLNASAMDYSRALQAYLNDWQTPQGQFLTREILNDSEIPHTYLSAAAGLKNTYAYGNEYISVNGNNFRGHQGAIGGYLSTFVYSRELGLGYAFSINTHNENFFYYASDLIRQFLAGRLPKTPSPADYPINPLTIPYSGYYRYSNPAQLYSGYFERLQNTFRLQVVKDSCVVKLLGGRTMIWKAADAARLWFRNSFEGQPHILFLKDGEHHQAITDNTMYFKKISALEAWVPVVLLLAGLLLLLSGLLFGLISVVFFLFRKIPLPELLLRISPALSAVGVILIIIVIPRLFEHMKECTPMDKLFNLWNAGKYMLAFSPVATLVLLAMQWNKITGRLLKVYLAALGFSGCYLTGIMVVNHWL